MAKHANIVQYVDIPLKKEIIKLNKQTTNKKPEEITSIRFSKRGSLLVKFKEVEYCINKISLPSNLIQTLQHYEELLNNNIAPNTEKYLKEITSYLNEILPEMINDFKQISDVLTIRYSIKNTELTFKNSPLNFF